MRTAISRLWSTIALCMAIVLVVALMAGCRPATPTTPVNDSGVTFESIELFTTDGVELRSRRVDWRSAGGENGTVWRTLDADDTINHDLYHSVEYHGGNAYFVRSDRRTIRRAPQTGTVEMVFTNDVPMLDWRVSLGGEYVAIYGEDGTHIDIWSINPRKLVETMEMPAAPDTLDGHRAGVFDKFGVWSFEAGGDDLDTSTFTAAAVPQIEGYVFSLVQFRIDRNDVPTVSTIPVSQKLNIPAGRFAFDPLDEIIAWDTMPVFSKTTDLQKFAATRAHTNLYLYSVLTGAKRCIDERLVCDFQPRWLTGSDLEENVAPEIGSPVKHTYIVRKDILGATNLLQTQELTFLYSIDDEQGHNKFYWGTIMIPGMSVWGNDTVEPAAQDRPVLVTHTAGALPGALLFSRYAPWFLLFDTRAHGNMAVTYDISKDHIPTSTLVTPLTYTNASQYLRDSATGWKAEKDTLAMIAKVAGTETVTGSFDCGGGVHCVTATAGTTKRYWLLDGTDSTLYGRIDLIPGVSITSYTENKSMTSLAKVDELGAENTGNGINNLFLPVSMPFPTELSLTMQSSMAAEQVVREHFRYWNERDLAGLERTMTPDKKGITWGLSWVDHVKLLSIKELASREENKKVFEVVFDFKRKNTGGDPADGASGMDNLTYTWGILLRRDNAVSPWLIYEWGGGGYDW
jgi:hypothetical protein